MNKYCQCYTGDPIWCERCWWWRCEARLKAMREQWGRHKRVVAVTPQVES